MLRGLGELCDHKRQAEYQDADQIDKEKGRSAVLAGLSGESPDVAEADCGSCGSEYEAELRAEAAA